MTSECPLESMTSKKVIVKTVLINLIFTLTMARRKFSRKQMNSRPPKLFSIPFFVLPILIDINTD